MVKVWGRDKAGDRVRSSAGFVYEVSLVGRLPGGSNVVKFQNASAN